MAMVTYPIELIIHNNNYWIHWSMVLSWLNEWCRVMINDGINDGDVAHEVLTSMVLMVIIMPMKVKTAPWRPEERALQLERSFPMFLSVHLIIYVIMSQIINKRVE